MARSVLVDTGFLVALISKRDADHKWAVRQATEYPPPWHSCEPVLSEAFHLLAEHSTSTLGELLRRGAVSVDFGLVEHLDPVLRLIHKYSNVPMSLADACLVRMTETLRDPVILSTDADFRIYRRHGRQTVPCILPG
jgi:uncharacterized protein